MAPTRQRKHGKSTESESSVDAMDFPAPPQTIPTKSSTPTRTPIRRSPTKKAPRGLTANQKQALLDNLQLESKFQNTDDEHLWLLDFTDGYP